MHVRHKNLEYPSYRFHKDSLSISDLGACRPVFLYLGFWTQVFLSSTVCLLKTYRID